MLITGSKYCKWKTWLLFNCSLKHCVFCSLDIQDGGIYVSFTFLLHFSKTVCSRFMKLSDFWCKLKKSFEISLQGYWLLALNRCFVVETFYHTYKPGNKFLPKPIIFDILVLLKFPLLIVSILCLDRKSDTLLFFIFFFIFYQAHNILKLDQYPSTYMQPGVQNVPKCWTSAKAC